MREDDVQAPAAYSCQALFGWNVFNRDAHVRMQTAKTIDETCHERAPHLGA